MFVKALECWEPGLTVARRNLGIRIQIYYPLGSLCLRLVNSGVQLLVFQPQASAPQLFPFQSTHGVVANTATKEAFDRIAHWLEHYLTSHRGCAVAGMDSYMPRRLLSISPKHGYHRDRVHLVEEASNILAPYAALSYCWGRNIGDAVRTLMGNRHRHMVDGIPINNLPQTIRDAITVCRAINLEYLWVDALCIVQDDKVDWKMEAESMYKVYANARLTIAAHAAVSCTDGFLGPQAYGHPDWQREFTSDLPIAGQTKMFLRLGTPPPCNSPPSSVLMTRAWAFQEAIFSRRTLHFMGVEMVWECDVLPIGAELKKNDLTYDCWIRVHKPNQAPHLYAHESGWCPRCQVDKAAWANPEFGCLFVQGRLVSAQYSIRIWYFLVLRRSTDIPDSWERVGLGKVSSYSGVRKSNPLEYSFRVETAKMEELRLV
ncbi:heterokaryon incompatibility protein-domain-containing protein [Cladorrhinum sp. PSN259]|nr:heterokaryon incompatibility protein-domain-containing protein [Cladorrhinum sp. PSN259]